MAGAGRLKGHRDVERVRVSSGPNIPRIGQSFSQHRLDNYLVILETLATSCVAWIQVLQPASIFLDTSALSNRLYLEVCAFTKVYIPAQGLAEIEDVAGSLIRSLVHQGATVIFVAGLSRAGEQICSVTSPHSFLVIAKHHSRSAVVHRVLCATTEPSASTHSQAIELAIDQVLKAGKTTTPEISDMSNQIGPISKVSAISLV